MSEHESAPLTEMETAGDGEEIVMDSPPDASEVRNRKVFSLPVQIMVSVGSATLTVQDLMALTPSSVIDLDAGIEDPVVIYVGERAIARGELLERENGAGLGVRLTELCDMKE